VLAGSARATGWSRSGKSRQVSSLRRQQCRRSLRGWQRMAPPCNFFTQGDVGSHVGRSARSHRRGAGPVGPLRDRDRFELLVERYQTRLVNYLYRMVRNSKRPRSVPGGLHPVYQALDRYDSSTDLDLALPGSPERGDRLSASAGSSCPAHAARRRRQLKRPSTRAAGWQALGARSASGPGARRLDRAAIDSLLGVPRADPAPPLR